MKRKVLAGLMAAPLLDGATAQATDVVKDEISAASVREIDVHYQENIQPLSVPWMTVTDHRWGVRLDDRMAYWGSYPEIRVEGDSQSVLPEFFLRWSMGQKRQNDEPAAEMGRINENLMKFDLYYDYTILYRCGCTDAQIVSFALRHVCFSGGAPRGVSREVGEVN